MKNLILLLGIGLLLGGCFKTSAHDGPRPGYMSASVDAGPVGHRSHARSRGVPNCGPKGTFSAKYGKCVGEFHDIELSASQKDTFASCERIMTRTVMQGSRLVAQQKGINCQRPQ